MTAPNNSKTMMMKQRTITNAPLLFVEGNSSSSSTTTTHHHHHHHRSTTPSSTTPRLTYCVLVIVSVLCGYALSSSNLFLRQYYQKQQQQGTTSLSSSTNTQAMMDAPQQQQQQHHQNQRITLSASISAEISNPTTGLRGGGGATTTTTTSSSLLPPPSSMTTEEETNAIQSQNDEATSDEMTTTTTTKETTAPVSSSVVDNEDNVMLLLERRVQDTVEADNNNNSTNMMVTDSTQTTTRSTTTANNNTNATTTTSTTSTTSNNNYTLEPFLNATTEEETTLLLKDDPSILPTTVHLGGNRNNNNLLKSYQYNENATGMAKVCQDFASQPVDFFNQGWRRRAFSNTTCGAMWNGDSLERDIKNWTSILHVHVVVAYCHNPLDWMVEQLEDLANLGKENNNNGGTNNNKSIKLTMTVYSKCGKEQLVPTFLKNATDHFVESLQVQTLPNVGGCDHTYAYWMKYEAWNSTADYVFFLKDTKRDDSLLSVNGKYRSTPDMLRVASHRGFACGLDTNALDNVPKRTGYVNGVTSVYHDTKRLYRYKMKLDTYQRASVREGLYNETVLQQSNNNNNSTGSGGEQQQQEEEVTTTTNNNNHDDDDVFASAEYKQMGPFVVRALTNKSQELCETLPICNHEEHTFVQVCYGGTFAVQRQQQIMTVDSIVFDRLVHILSRGNNIEEGHYVERSWAGILAPPITKEEREGLLTFANSKVTEMPGVFGAMARTWVGNHPKNFTRVRNHQIWRPEVQ